MYATAHRVRTAEGKAAINTFLHLHDTDVVEGIGRWIDYERITQQDPGRLVATEFDVAPGGNAVLSWLDLIAPDESELPTLRDALRHARAAVDLRSLPIRRQFRGRIGIQFGATLGLDDALVLQEYDHLAERLLHLLTRRPPPPWETAEPFIVRVEEAGDRVTLRLDAASRARVPKAAEVGLPVAAVSVESATLSAFEEMHGDFIRHVLPALTGLTLDDIARSGGVRLVSTSDRTLWEWPRRTPAAP